MYEWLINPAEPPLWILITSLIVFISGIVARPFTSYLKFVYPTAKYEAIGNPFIQEKNLTPLIESKNLQEFIETLNTTKDYTITGDTIKQIQNNLNTNLYETIEMMRKDSSKTINPLYDLYLEKIDMFHIKNTIKQKLLNIPITTDTPKLYLEKTQNVLTQLTNADKEHLPDILKTYGFKDEHIQKIMTEPPNPLNIDIAFDTYYLNQFTTLKLPYKANDAKQQLISTTIDMHNIKNILRATQLGYKADVCHTLYIPKGREIAHWKFKELADLEGIAQIISALEGTTYFQHLKEQIEHYNKEQTVQVFINALDSLMLKLIKDISQKYYLSIGPTLRFLISKEQEIQNLKVISKGVGEQIPANRIKSLLLMEAS